MLRDVAVTRIQDGLGFATRQSDKIILRLQEAQRDLELGKTLPKFLLQEDATLALVAGNATVALPARFLRIDDEFRPYFIPSGETAPTYLMVTRSYYDARAAYLNDDATAEGPRVLVVRDGTVDFVNRADVNYTIVWQYYAGAALLTSNIENEWLANAPEALIGEAGWRMAMDLRDKDAVTIFDNMRKTGRAAMFGEIIADEEASGPIMMGMNL